MANKYEALKQKGVVIGFFDVLRTKELDENISKGIVPMGFGLPTTEARWPSHGGGYLSLDAGHNFLREDNPAVGSFFLSVARAPGVENTLIKEVAAVEFDTISEAYEWLHGTDTGKQFKEAAKLTIISAMAGPTDLGVNSPTVNRIRDNLGLMPLEIKLLT
jgi:hypothetical protein